MSQVEPIEAHGPMGPRSVMQPIARVANLSKNLRYANLCYGKKLLVELLEMKPRSYYSLRRHDVQRTTLTCD